jgi:hypothetical protein
MKSHYFLLVTSSAYRQAYAGNQRQQRKKHPYWQKHYGPGYASWLILWHSVR